MNKKPSFAQAPAYLTKVKKEKPTKSNKPFTGDVAQEQRHEKINFKQYLRDLKEEQASNDEFQDIPVISMHALLKENLDNSEIVRSIDFGGDVDSKLLITEDQLSQIIDLEKDDSITITDDFDDLWYVSRTLNNQIVFESQEYALSGKLDFDSFIKAFK